MRKITQLERIKSKAPRIALAAFRANPSLGGCEAKALFAEIVAHIKAGRKDADIVKAVLEKHAANKPSGKLSLH